MVIALAARALASVPVSCTGVSSVCANAAVAPNRKPRTRWSAAAQIRSPTRWKPNIE